MFNKYIKLVLAAGVLVWAVFQFIDENIMNGISLILLAGIFVLFYFKNEFILLSFLQLRKQNFAGASKWRSYIKFAVHGPILWTEDRGHMAGGEQNAI